MGLDVWSGVIIGRAIKSVGKLLSLRVVKSGLDCLQDGCVISV